MFVPPVPVTLLLVWRRLAEYMYRDVVFVQEETIAALLILIPAMIIFVISVVVTMRIVVLGDGDRRGDRANSQQREGDISSEGVHRGCEEAIR